MASCGFTSGLYEDILKAQEYTKSQNYLEASKIYKKILEKEPNQEITIKVNFQLGEINSIFLNNPQKAIKYYEEVIKISYIPLWQIKSLEKIAEIYFTNLKNYKKATENYERLVEFKPKLEKFDEYKFNIARSLFYDKNFDEALKRFNELGSNRKLYESYHYIGLIHFYRSRWKKAIDSWFEYLKREKRKNKIVNTKFLIANAYESAENLKRAYNIYYSLLGEYPNQDVLKARLKSIYNRRVARKR